ncbi:CrcB family protein [Dermatophilaceae bacterium Soc4.6]
MVLAVLIGLGGGLGAASRFLVDDLVTRRRARAGRVGGVWALPWATIIINVSGSLLLGLLTGLTAARVLGGDLAAIAGTGFCGGFTTFSTATVETLRLAQRRESPLAALNAIGTTALALVAAGLGWWAAAALSP